VREQVTAELMTLKIQLHSCANEISSLQNQLQDLRKQINDNAQITSAELANLTQQLEERETLYATLSRQLTDLQNYLAGLETENDILWGVVGGIGVAAFIYGLIKSDQVLCWSGAGLAMVSAGRFVIRIIF
jgi:ABC-type transporter Mla subunit MlaD